MVSNCLNTLLQAGESHDGVAARRTGTGGGGTKVFFLHHAQKKTGARVVPRSLMTVYR